MASDARGLDIVHVCRIGWPSQGGMETFVQGLSEALLRRGHRPRVVTLRRSVVDGRLLPEGTCRGVPYERVWRIGPRRYPCAVGLGRRIRSADVVHAHGLDGLLDALVWSDVAPVVVSTHGGYFHTERHSRLKRLWARTLTQSTLRRSAAVWFTSRRDQTLFGGATGRVMESGHDLAPLLALTAQPEEGLWLIPGRVALHKGHDDAIRLVAKLDSDSRPKRLVSVGPGADPHWGRHLDRLAQRLGVPWERIGAVDELTWRGWLSRASRVLCPSRAEGFGLALLEAMAAGRPVVARDLPTHRHLLGAGVVSFSTPEDLLRPVSGSSGRTRAKAWDWDARIADFEQGYREVLR